MRLLPSERSARATKAVYDREGFLVRDERDEEEVVAPQTAGEALPRPLGAGSRGKRRRSRAIADAGRRI